MTAELTANQRERLAQSGYGFIDADSGFATLGRYLAAPTVNSIAIVAGDTRRLATLPGAANFWTAAGANDNRAPRKVEAVTSAVLPLVIAMQAAGMPAAIELMQDHLATLVATMTSRDNSRHVDISAGFLDLGIDSLAALELRKKLETALGIKLKSTLILDYPNIGHMAAMLAERTMEQHAQTPAAAVVSQATATVSSSRADLLAQLANEID